MGWYTNVIRSLGHRPVFAMVGRAAVPVDRWLQQKTGGRLNVLGRLALPTMLLTTQGRKSGLPRTVPLLYAPDGDTFVVTASNWGQQNHPAWSGNLLACNEATVALPGGRQIPVRAALAEGLSETGSGRWSPGSGLPTTRTSNAAAGRSGSSS